METSDASQAQETRGDLSPAWFAAGTIGLLVLGLLAYALFAQPTEPPQIGSPVPDFRLTTLDNRSMNLSDHRGQVVVLNFFASWCGPCRQEAADMEQAWREYQDSGVQFLGIAYKDAPSKARVFLDSFDVSYPISVETGNRTARAYGVTGVPETFVIDPSGNLVRHFIGPITLEELAQEIEPLLGQ